MQLPLVMVGSARVDAPQKRAPQHKELASKRKLSERRGTWRMGAFVQWWLVVLIKPDPDTYTPPSLPTLTIISSEAEAFATYFSIFSPSFFS